MAVRRKTHGHPRIVFMLCSASSERKRKWWREWQVGSVSVKAGEESLCPPSLGFSLIGQKL